MQTYTKTIEKPRLVIEYDADGMSPRDWDNLGYFVTVERNYMSPDKNEQLRDIIESTQYDVNNSDEHADAIKKEFEENSDEKILLIVPVYRYEHGNVIYRRGNGSGWDSSNCGFYIVTDKTADVLGTPADRFARVIDSELEEYTKYANGEIYAFTLYDENGEIEDSCGGFYDIEDIKEHLPKEYADDDLNDYLKI